jgi:hypothetical protein
MDRRYALRANGSYPEPIRPKFFPCPGREKSLNRGFGSLDRFSTSLFHPRLPVPWVPLCFRKLPWTYLSVMTG